MKVSVCIPTRNRPDEALACVQSLQCSTIPVFEVIVSDDSTDNQTRALLADHCPNVIFIDGPKKGLGPNRNNAVSRARGDWILFLDDDARLTPDFLSAVRREMPHELPEQTIYTGIERNSAGVVYPNDQGFLGFQDKAYQTRDIVRTIVMNAAVFPAPMFKELLFDPALVYGYDEIDIAARALARGYKIRLCPDAINLHFSSPLNREFNAPHIESARIYVTYRKYRASQARPLKAAAFLIASLLHSVAHQVKISGPGGMRRALQSHSMAWGQIRRAAP